MRIKNESQAVRKMSAHQHQPSNPRSLPCILACGYRLVHNAKTGNTFPAWLVSTPTASQGGDEIQLKCYWRSKRDFLLLSRAVANAKAVPSCNCSPQKKLRVFPKAAFTKLCENYPWKSPHLKTNTAELFPKDLKDPTNNNHKNCFQPSMKKNLLQMDQFLQSIPLHIYNNELDPEIVSSLTKAWEEFCRPSDTTDVSSSTDHTLSNTNNESVEDATLPTPQALGQYFCTKENANQLMQTLLDKLSTMKTYNPKQTNLIILEPSCGHGDVIWALLEQQKKLLSNLQAQYQNVTILGLDLDPRAIEVCQKRVSNPVLCKGKNLHLEFECVDFLSTQRSTFVQKVQNPTGDTDGQSTTRVVAIGGPPYGSKPEERELPVNFVKHCIKEWQAEVVAFLLPQRFPESIDTSEFQTYSSQGYALQDSTFFYEGKRPVTQPSRIQCWWTSH